MDGLDCFFTPWGGGGGGELYYIMGKAWGKVHRFRGGGGKFPLRPPGDVHMSSMKSRQCQSAANISQHSLVTAITDQFYELADQKFA